MQNAFLALFKLRFFEFFWAGERTGELLLLSLTFKHPATEPQRLQHQIWITMVLKKQLFKTNHDKWLEYLLSLPKTSSWCQGAAGFKPSILGLSNRALYQCATFDGQIKMFALLNVAL